MRGIRTCETVRLAFQNVGVSRPSAFLIRSVRNLGDPATIKCFLSGMGLAHFESSKMQFPQNTCVQDHPNAGQALHAHDGPWNGPS